MADQAQVAGHPVAVEILLENLGEGALADTLRPLWKLVSNSRM